MSSAADIAHLVNVNGGLVTPFATSSTGNINCVWAPDGTEIIYTLGRLLRGEISQAARPERNVEPGLPAS